MENFVKMLKEKRAEITDLIMWEICKNSVAAAKEFDR